MTRIVGLACALVFVMSTYVLAQTEFSADIVNEGNQNRSTRMYVGKDKLRFDGMGTSGHGAGSVIIDPASQKTIVLMPERHMYMEVPQEQTMNQTMNVFHVQDVDNACSQWLAMDRNKGGTCHKLGTETVNGRSTVKYEGTDAKGKSGTVWIDPKLHFPVKWQGQNEQGGELRNIQEGSQPSSLFEVPAGYTKFDMGGMMMRPPQQH